MYRILSSVLTLAILLLLVGASSFYIGTGLMMKKLSSQETSFNEKIASLEQQLNDVNSQLQNGQKQITQLSIDTLNSHIPTAELQRRQEVIVQQSKEDTLTNIVERTTPGVVSIVVSKDVPQLEVVYQNPFGDDPFFKNFGFQVPVYRQKGTIRQKVGAGTGFLITRDGYILTNKHVVDDSAAIYTVLLANGDQKQAKVIYRDSNQDIALIKIDGSHTPLMLGDSTTSKLGETVVAIGNALGEYNNSVSVGIISGLDRTIQAADSRGRIETIKGVIQTDAAINRGNSGGPLINLEGKVIGINVATVAGSNNISFAIPINIAKSILVSVLEK
ncbi:MAG: trypsin-like peptidase domain-containing protein [Candidatus Wildermuthbacteria bacterium]|nr:trypsin-like peptidase domain-containing protein [Candidatus Wildermuthbacteria bacterium]